MSTMLEKVVTAWVRAWAHGETRAFEEIVADSYVRHSKTGQEQLDVVIRQIETSHTAFSDFTVKILHAVEDDQWIAIHWQSTGTHTGEYMGVPPTGRTVAVSGAAFIKHANGKILEETTVWDPRELLSAMKIMHLGTSSTRAKEQV
ncbi:ester cyclase [Cryobacterium melibiosiphilum]|uniref:ester cyclase n=1 Tax=Cryobacterium melibiosiphilum TaxID=995039 RepID=UPI001F3A5C86|nr:ester cyclase [Cryobacterium melibiosiphilum]